MVETNKNNFKNLINFSKICIKSSNKKKIRSSSVIRLQVTFR